MQKRIFVALFLVALAFGSHFERWHAPIYVAELLGAYALSEIIASRVHPSAGFAWWLAMLSCIDTYSLGYGRLEHALGGGGTYGLLGEVSFQNQTMGAALFLLLLTLPFLFAGRRERQSVRRALEWLCILDSLIVIALRLTGWAPDFIGGFMGNPSMNACLIAVLFPLVHHKTFEIKSERVPLVVREAFNEGLVLATFAAPILAVLASDSSMGVGVLVVVIAVMGFGHLRFKKAVACVAIMWALILVPAYFIFAPHKGLFHDGDRFLIWHTVMHWWWQFGPKAFGTGQGTALIWVPRIHHLAHVRENVNWYWLHNDWLQLVFEQGLVSLGAVALMLVCAIRSAARAGRWKLVAALCGFVVMACGNYPCRMALSSIVGVFLVVACFAAQHPAVEALERQLRDSVATALGKSVSDDKIVVEVSNV